MAISGLKVLRDNTLYCRILDNVPNLILEIEYDGNNGYYNNDCYELQYCDFLITIDISIEYVRYITSSDNLSPEECEEVLIDIDIVIKEIWINNKEYLLSEKQNNELVKKIIEAII